MSKLLKTKNRTPKSFQKQIAKEKGTSVVKLKDTEMT